MKVFGAVLSACMAMAAAAADLDLSQPINSQAIIDVVNAAGTTWTAGHNARFEGRTLEHAKVLCGTLMEGPTFDAAQKKLWKKQYVAMDVPATFDSAKAWPQCASVITHIRDQAACGSCWAFGSTEAFNNRLCIATNGSYTHELSAQDTASCCNMWSGCFGSQGCEGGLPSEAWSYFQNTGIVTGGDYDTIGSGSSCFPYQIPNCDHHEDDGPYPECGNIVSTPACPAPKACSEKKYDTPWAKDKQFATSAYSLPDVTSIQQDIMKYGSVTAAFTVYSDFLTYRSGVYQHTTGQAVGGHAVRIEGWGVENGTPYWLVANSWNKYWGDKGYFKILRGSDECGIESQVVAGTA